ncbi:MAG: hypothetical protein RR807_06400 [Oscillospiraceae bacterium]
MKKPMKKFAIGILTGSLALLCAGALLVAICDPFFRMGPPRDQAVYINERYENPGMIRNLDYDTVVMGTSLVCNYRASWYGDDAIKISYRDGYFSEFDTALDLAFRTHPDISKVYFGADLNILIRHEEERKSRLEAYLYNDNPLDDVSYFLNMEVYLRCINMLLNQQAVTTLDESYVQDETVPYTREKLLANFHRPPLQEQTLPEDIYYAGCDENLAVLDRWLTAHPDTEFTVFLSSYSILYWDLAQREGSLEARLAALRYVAQHLQGYENLRLVFLMDDEETITNLNHYMDHVHCDSYVSHLQATRMQGEDYLLTAENYEEVLAHFAEFVRHYDYDAIYATP